MERNTCNLEKHAYDSIVDAYMEYGSIKAASDVSGSSEVTVRRVLITEGLWSSDTSERIGKLRGQGMTVKEIAEELSISTSAVTAYLPYSRGKYGEEETESSRNSKEYRNRKSAAQKSVNTLTQSGGDQILSGGTLPGAAEEGPSAVGTQEPPAGEEDLILKLHLELVGGYDYGAERDLDLDDEEREELFSLAKAEKGISRDILVPGDMTFHALHYAIQKLFGWQNGHQHDFRLPADVFSEVTGGEKFGIYTDLCGVLFRFPDEDMSEFYWDDDYDEDISVKSWLQKKYSAPFLRGGLGDTYFGNHWKVEGFMERFPRYDGETALRSIQEDIMIMSDFNQLIEHLTVGELMCPPSAGQPDWEAWREKIRDRKDAMEASLRDDGSYPEDCPEEVDELREWRASMGGLSSLKWRNPDGYRSEVREQLGVDYETALAYHKSNISSWTRKCRKIFYDWNIKTDPVLSELYYCYDYGDDWCLRITAEDRQHNRLAYELLNGKPQCVHADGLNLVDNCGGIGGYLDMLRDIFGDDRQAAREMKEWASSLGWTGKKSAPANML